ncbi:deoxyribonuclease IV [Candidatus Falkowbacteria bacterium]|jgi:deoxyribonuclease IV|nr:deoxyribonuclease IV [Candidatus Falkowbacteria bacterium]MBT5503100.1 deoxyribonuclease IV [Candidatus Falkowbacteria bacterium]MBT6574194.1 deoxyribonuclease IV [Candidatus Falkowbacteria bacterium]MBT7348659.1 deoxyribonuclease IV [Candidatus Falkowbacteria bacterium]MBT7500449.1 deoxyribonuclease IV [Candidatus Falkowbacteria bacterium]
MKFGVHVSIAGGIQNAPINAHKKGCEVFQFFSRSPRGGKPTYTKETIEKFKSNCEKFGFTEYYIHTPYYINLASSNDRIRHGSITAIRDELEVGSRLGAKYVMTHLGSAKDYSESKAQQLVIKGIKEILKSYKGTTILLLENSAGSGQIIGDEIDELGKIMKGVSSNKVGICYDTCHGFASGYDIRTKLALNKTLKEFDKYIGLDKLKLFHFNDSKTELGSKRDRHENIGKGFIGKTAFDLIINHPKLKKVDAVLETHDVVEDNIPSLNLLKKLRK